MDQLRNSRGLLWKGYALGALALLVTYFLVGGHADAQTGIYQLFTLAAPIAILVGIRRNRPDARLPWLLFVCGFCMWAIGDTYWDCYRWIVGEQAPYPSFADIAYLGGYPFLVAGAFVLVRGWGRPRIGNLLDSVIVALAACLVSVLVLLNPLLHTPEPAFGKAMAIGSPVMDILLLLALTQMMFRWRVRNLALQSIMVATGALLLADGAYSYLGLQGTYESGMFIDAGWLVCSALWGTAALHPSMVGIRSLPEQTSLGLSAWRVGALLTAMLVAPVALIVETLGQPTAADEIGAAIVVTTILVGARVWLLQRDGKKAQADLARSGERLRLAHSVAGVSSWDMNLVTGELTISDELARMITGSIEGTAVIEDWIAFIHPDDRYRITTNFEHTRAQGGDFEHEYRFRSRNGREGWVFSRGRVLHEDGVAVRAVGVTVDVTERHRLEEDMEQAAEGFRLAEEAANVGTWDLDLATGNLAWSDSMRSMIGVTPDFVPTFEAFVDWIHPDDRARVQREIGNAHERGIDFEVEHRVRQVRESAERWVESRGRGVLDDNGRPARSVGVAVDVTQRHAMQEQLVRSDERMRLAQELGGIGTWDAELDTGKRTWSNNLRAIYGVDDSVDASHEAFMELVHPDDRQQVEEEMLLAAEEGGHGEFEFRLVRPSDGAQRWLLSRGNAVESSNGRLLLGVAVDITDRRVAEEQRTKLEQQLRQAHKLEAVGRLAGGVAHDFNNILLAIRGNGELALDSLKQGEDAIEEVKEMVSAANRAASLTAQLLAFSRRQVLQAEVLDLNEVVVDMDKLLRRMLGEDVELHAIVTSAPVNISADRSQIEQVIANLAVNARDAMPKGGELTVQVQCSEIGSDASLDLAPGHYAMVTVSDTGHGMDPETVARIFEPFFTTKDEGTGFGLSTVHGIVVQSGGTVWVYSEPGHGTTFKIFLPLVEQPQALESKVPVGGKPEIAPTTGQTILLVEDDPHVRRIVRNILVRSGYRVLAASGADEALRLAAAEPATIHLLLSDLVMPGTSGRELADMIRPLRPSIAILYMSGYTDDAVIRRGVLEAGMAFIQKPFGAEDLGRRIRELLDARDEDQPVAA